MIVRERVRLWASGWQDWVLWDGVGVGFVDWGVGLVWGFWFWLGCLV